jgi:hypothetical protein
MGQKRDIPAAGEARPRRIGDPSSGSDARMRPVALAVCIDVAGGGDMAATRSSLETDPSGTSV